MFEEQALLMKEIMEIGFCVIETAMFLDTHPTDERALGLHNTYSTHYRELCDTYEMKYGPLTSQGLSKNPWEFIDEPWPWDADYINCCM